MIGYFPPSGGASRISPLTLGGPAAGYSTIVGNVREDFAGYVPFAGVFRERSTKVIVRLPTANGPVRRGCAVVVVALERVTRAARDAFAPESQPSSAPAEPIDSKIAIAAVMFREQPPRRTGAMAAHTDT